MGIKKIVLGITLVSIVSQNKVVFAQMPQAFESPLAGAVKDTAGEAGRITDLFFTYNDINSFAQMLGDFLQVHGFEVSSSPSFNYALYMLAGTLARHFTIEQLNRLTNNPSRAGKLSAILLPVITSLYFARRYGISNSQKLSLMGLISAKISALIFKEQFRSSEHIKPHLP